MDTLLLVSFFYLLFGGRPPLFLPGPSGLKFFCLPALSGRFPFFAFSFLFVFVMGSRTVVFDVRDFRPNMEREEMAQTFFDQFKDEHVISAIQIVPGGVCKVTFESAGVKQDLCSRDICNVGGVDCRVLNHAKRVTSVQVHHYPFENDLDPLFKVLSPFGKVKRTRFQHWTNIPEINTGTILLDVILNHHIPRTLKVGKLRVKVWYRDQPLCCDICQGPHRVTDCDLRGKCRRCGEALWARTGNAASRTSDVADPTPAEATGRATVTDAASDANHAPVADADRAAGPPAVGAHDAALPTSQALSEPDSLDGATFDSSAGTPLVDATPPASLSFDHRDNQLDELSSQPLLFSPTPSGSDFDSLDGATVDSGLVSPVPRGPSVVSLPNVDGATKDSSTGLLDKLKSKVGLNKKKEHKEKVINTYDSDISLNNGNTHNDKGKVISTNESDISLNYGNISNESVISNNDSSQNLFVDGQNTEYIGQGILAGQSDSEMDLVVESQKRAHPDSSEDTADSDHFSVPAKPAPRPPKKKPPVVVSSGKSRPVPVADHGRDRSRSRSPPGRSPSASCSASSGKHSLPSGVGYEKRPPRGSGGSKGSKK